MRRVREQRRVRGEHLRRGVDPERKVGFGTLYKPVLFEMPNDTYLTLGDVVAMCKHVE